MRNIPWSSETLPLKKVESEAFNRITLAYITGLFEVSLIPPSMHWAYVLIDVEARVDRISNLIFFI